MVGCIFLAVAALSAGGELLESPEAEFHMARLVYASGYAGRSWRPWWAIDYPDAEYHFTRGLRRLTSLDVADDSQHIRLTDEELFDYPWLFAQQVGHWSLDEVEIARLREYVLRGGFLVVDDFHGEYEWVVFSDVMRRAFPDWPIARLPETHPLMNVLYDLDQDTQIPGRRHLYRTANGNIEAMLRGPAQWHAIYDNNERLVVAINFNMDMGDAWEHADDPVYPVPMTSLAYRFAVNYVIYAMTH
ncbi:MAG: DUF4159 domain-containing protein [Proteobacteria bacterium]|nr:DUF4159 domain-containing protein [Pseudomonadota bacterium]